MMFALVGLHISDRSMDEIAQHVHQRCLVFSSRQGKQFAYAFDKADIMLGQG
jgi:hypothetical protein